MYIQEIVVDGFKSYAHRTVIQGFDPHFNAITGLNGSGKSNILDSICFVLGITNLSQVRAGNLSELVYKQGQAGVTKASVTIVFNNSDPNSSPLGYEQSPEVTVTRQVLIGGKSKYFINGRTAPAKQVADLFHSVQLNVNNPHFLIMQGRITKVLNMKPNEILGMVEEAAGTRMYETKRVAAIKTIEKKQMKVDELNSVLSEEITPTLERLRGEKQHYLTWSKNNADIERLERFVVASEYARALQVLTANSDGVTELEDKVREYETLAQSKREQLVKTEEDISVLSTQLSGEFKESHTQMKEREEKCSKDLVKATSAWQNKKSVATSAEEDVTAARELLAETKTAVSSKESEIQTESDGIDTAKQEAAKAEEELQRMASVYQQMSAGISSDDSEEGRTLPDQISKAHTDANNADAKAKQAQMKIKHLSKSLSGMEKEMKKQAASADKLAKKRDKSQQLVEELNKKLSQIDFSEQEYTSLENEKIELDDATAKLRETIDTLTAQIEGRLAFKYSDPVRGFDRTKVKGLVARLIDVKKPETSTALEVTAGSKLYQVVVDEVITGKALLSKGKLQRRVTIIPLDKISSRRMTSATCEKAASIAKNLGTTASPAIELVGFDEEVRNAVEYVFGSTIVVDGMKAANQICDTTRTRTVTLEGDVYDPSGTISGGSRNNLGSTLSKLAELTAASSELSDKEGLLKQVTSRLQSMKSISKKFEDFTEKLAIATAELESAEKHLSQTTYGMLSAKHDAMKAEVEQASEELEHMRKEKDAHWARYHELKEKEEQLSKERQERFQKIEQELKEAKKLAAEKSAYAREAASRSERLQMELENLKAECVAADQAVLSAMKVLEKANEEEQKSQMKVGELKGLYDEAKLELDEVEKRMSSCSCELKTLSKTKARLSKEAETAELEARKVAVKIDRVHKDKNTAERHVAHMRKKHVWIESEKAAFGVKGGDYDFEASDKNPAEMSEQLHKLKEEQNHLSKKINKKVMGMIEKAEGEYLELLRKRKVVENDKKKIEAVIEELDVKKKSELERTWMKVTRDFGSIFSTLLPGTQAKLEPPEGMQAWEGLEVKVAFGDAWKESLGELSGGQRSLLALSLILSLLLFKPAPMYILDEVDAALDLSHTQNIGNMLKTHFSQSQFIVVSLKEGMFNNANVIFRTKFVDGVSTVTRTIGMGESSSSSNNNNNDENESSPQRKRAAASGGRRSRRAEKENMQMRSN